MSQSSRRSFLKQSAAVAAGLAAARWYGPGIVQAADKGDKVRVAQIGCGGQGSGTHVTELVRERLVALVDTDPSKFANCYKNAQKVDPNFDPSKVKTFDDYRKLFDTMHKEIDAVSIATPNHQHALPAMIALKLGIGTYVEKPLAYNIHEVRELTRLAAEAKVPTQMGNQGHSGEGYRRLCEFIWAGLIGNVTEVYHWSDRSNGGVGGRPPSSAPPKGMNWDNWIGPGPFREYHKGLHPHEWHGWHDFGNGSLGNMACHIMDGAHWALKLEHPTAIECEELVGGSVERYGQGTRLRWDFPARGDMPAVKLWWYDGRARGAKAVAGTGRPEDDTVDPKSHNVPPLKTEWEKKIGRELESNGTIYVGDKGTMFTGCYGGGVSFLPDRKGFTIPPAILPRIKGSHHGNFFNAFRTGEAPVSNFAVSSKLAEVVLLGCLAIKAGPGKKVEWDGANCRCTNLPEINGLIQRDYRKGWVA